MLPYHFSLLVLAAILLMALLASLLAAKMQKSSLVFYVLLGVLVGKLFLGSESIKGFVEILSSLGLSILLFTIGLELPIKQLWRSGRLLVVGSLAQVGLTALFLTVPLFFLFGNFGVSFLIALALSMSSTAVVAKLLQSKAEDSSLSGEITTSILIFQDLVSVALITLLTFLVKADSGPLGLTVLFLQKILVVALIFTGLTWIINLVFDRFRLNREELSLFTFAAMFLTIGLFGWLSIPETTAGFIVGVLLAGRYEQHEIFSQVRVFRDILLVFFFFFLGTYIQDLNLGILFWSLPLSLLFMLIKFLGLFTIFIVLGLHRKTSFWISFDLMQSGEFAFILLTVMNQGGLLEGQTYQLLIMIIIWSLLIFSSLYQAKIKFYRRLEQIINQFLPCLNNFSGERAKLKFDQLKLRDHIVLCGYGRVGGYVGHGLVLSGLPLVVIDTDVTQIKKLLARGVSAIYGDATEAEILDYAQVDRAKFLVVAVPSALEQEQIIFAAKKLNPKIQILTRTHLSTNLRHFKSLGVTQVIQPEFEAAITLLKKLLKLYNFDKTEISKRTQYLKMEHGIKS